MDDTRTYKAIEISFSDNDYDKVSELEDHLQMNGYDYYLSNNPIYPEQMVLLINEDQAGWIDTILDDRDIEFSYI